MSTRKLFCCLLCVFGILLLFSGCSAQSPSLQEPTCSEIPPSDTYAMETVPLTSKESVIAAIDETISWTDGVGNNNIVQIRIPQISSDSPYTDAYNAEIFRYGSEILAQVKDAASGAYSTHIASVDFEYWHNGNILSILLTTRTCTDYIEYRADNFDTANKKVMSTAAICREFLNLDYPVFLKYTRDKLLQDFESEHADFISRFPEDYAFVKDLYLSDISIVKNYQLFPDQSGTLMLVCDRPAIAGAGYYAEICEMSVDSAILPTEQDAWNWLFDLYLGADQDNIEFARDILIAAYEEDEDSFSSMLKDRPRNERDAVEAAIRVKYDAKG